MQPNQTTQHFPKSPGGPPRLRQSPLPFRSSRPSSFHTLLPVENLLILLGPAPAPASHRAINGTQWYRGNWSLLCHLWGWLQPAEGGGGKPSLRTVLIYDAHAEAESLPLESAKLHSPPSHSSWHLRTRESMGFNPMRARAHGLEWNWVAPSLFQHVLMEHLLCTRSPEVRLSPLCSPLPQETLGPLCVCVSYSETLRV